MKHRNTVSLAIIIITQTLEYLDCLGFLRSPYIQLLTIVAANRSTQLMCTTDLSAGCMDKRLETISVELGLRSLLNNLSWNTNKTSNLKCN